VNPIRMGRVGPGFVGAHHIDAVIEAALAEGTHVISDQPLATTVAEAQAQWRAVVAAGELVGDVR
jgi:predicted dehydrogenase